MITYKHDLVRTNDYWP